MTNVLTLPMKRELLLLMPKHLGVSPFPDTVRVSKVIYRHMQEIVRRRDRVLGMETLMPHNELRYNGMRVVSVEKLGSRDYEFWYFGGNNPICYGKFTIPRGNG